MWLKQLFADLFLDRGVVIENKNWSSEKSYLLDEGKFYKTKKNNQRKGIV